MHLLSYYPRTRDGRQRHQNSDTQHSRVEFYTVYDREAKSFDEKYVEACQTNLSDVSLFVRLFIFEFRFYDPSLTSVGLGWFGLGY